MSLDLDELRIVDMERWAVEAAQRGILRSQRPRRFVRPLPWPWIVRAAQLPGAALRVAILLGWQAGMQRTLTDIRVPTAARREIGVSARSYRRAVHVLEGAGLIRVRRRPGCTARIALVMEH